MTKMVCIKRGAWVGARTSRPTVVPSPNYGEIVTVVGHRMLNGHKYFILAEYPTLVPGKPYPYGWREDFFRPINFNEQFEGETAFDFRKKLTPVKEDA